MGASRVCLPGVRLLPASQSLNTEVQRLQTKTEPSQMMAKNYNLKIK